MATTFELVRSVRDALFEYNSDPISDEYIVRRMNEAYRYAYNFFCKESDTMFGRMLDFPIQAGRSSYELPKNLWNKRIEHLQVPSPPNQSVDPWGYLKIPKVDYKQTYRYQTNRIRTYYPVCWSQLNNTISLFPPPLIGFTAKMIVSRDLVPLGIYGGRIIELGSNEITVDTTTIDGEQSFYDSRISTEAGDSANGFLSICDCRTGEVKAIFAYSTADRTTGVITLSAPVGGRTTYFGETVTTLPGTDWDSLGITQDDYISFGHATSVSILGSAFDTFLTDWATMKIRGALNETDPEVTNSLKLQLKELAGDLGGRPIGLKIARTTANNWGTRQFRRT